MAIPKLKKEDINKALAYIDKNGVPDQHKSYKYELVTPNGTSYPPKYVIAVANHLANKTAAISTYGYNAVEAKNYLKGKGFIVQSKQEFVLTITKDKVESTDPRFTMDDINLGDKYEPIDTFYIDAAGNVKLRTYAKGERRNCNQTMPRLACEIFEKQLDALSATEKSNFPICQYNPTSDIIRGIYSSEAEFRKNHRNSIEFLTYNYSGGKQFVFYCWNIFTTILFVKECLERFGSDGDQFILKYCEQETDTSKTDGNNASGENHQSGVYKNEYSPLLVESKNIIFRGAPGTGKSYLAKEIAADIISNGACKKLKNLSKEQLEQVEFVQFHPSYDYADFVEGLRPKINDDGSMGFELQDGIFKRFVDRARKNYENSTKPVQDLEKELSVQEAIEEFFSSIEFGVTPFTTINGSDFTVTEIDEKHIYVSIPGNSIVNKLCLNLDELRKMLESGENFEKIKDITKFFGKTFAVQAYSYNFAIYKKIKERNISSTTQAQPEQLKKYIFIIDEINRGEISKIFGELFFAVDPGYRGEDGAVATQYANLHSDPTEKFYIPDNVYIIGTMNDIDRSVDTFDFAMRRRFRFIEIKADKRLEMLGELGDEAKKAEAIRRMTALNNEIMNVEDLNENYQIGAAYFLKLKNLSFDKLWTDYLKPLLQEYVQGMSDERSIMNSFERAYGFNLPTEGDTNDDAQD